MYQINIYYTGRMLVETTDNPGKFLASLTWSGIERVSVVKMEV
jgi:hypothetical protein